MTELERMKHHSTVVEIAKKLKLQFKEVEVRSLKVVHIKSYDGADWILFDPINQGKDFAKALYIAAKLEGEANGEVEFRKSIMDKVLNHDFPV